jgi:hypothetical protein
MPPLLLPERDVALGELLAFLGCAAVSGSLDAEDDGGGAADRMLDQHVRAGCPTLSDHGMRSHLEHGSPAVSAVAGRCFARLEESGFAAAATDADQGTAPCQQHPEGYHAQSVLAAWEQLQALQTAIALQAAG